MQLEEGIKRVLDHEGILFLGSGFSTGGKNRNGSNMLVGGKLAEKICEDAGMDISDDLAMVSERYIDDETVDKTLDDFIKFLKNEVYCTETSNDQNSIANLPWHRIYTTNYDNSFEIASEKCNCKRESITITNTRYKIGRKLDQAIIHINGSVLNLNEKTFYDEFKITDENYTKKGLLDSSWFPMFEKDLKTASVVFFVGYSLSYDQELVKFISQCGIQDKCIFIDRDYEDKNKDFKFKKYGSLYKIGVDGFADEIIKVSNSYTPNIKAFTLKGFEKRDVSEYYSDTDYSMLDVLALFAQGKLEKKYMSSEYYCLQRTELVDKVERLLDEKNVIVIQSSLGNGKTILLECIAKRLVNYNNVYFVKNLDDMLDDLNYIQSTSDKNSILMIDDYGYYTRLLEELGRDFPENMKIIMTCRTSINSNLYSDITEKYRFDMEKIELIDIDEMSDKDVTETIEVFEHNQLWGQYKTQNNTKKKKLLVEKFGRRISKLFYLLLNSEVIKEEIESVVESIRCHQGLYDFVLALSINSICNLKFSYEDLRGYVNVTDSQLRSYEIDKNVRELLCVTGENFSLSSSIYAQYLVRKSGMKSNMLDMLANIYRGCSFNDDLNGKYYQQRRNMVSRSNVKLLLNCSDGYDVSEDDEKAILGYFDQIKGLPTADQNPYFWLQFGITSLNLKKYLQADICFKNAYSNASLLRDFDTFQIDTHKARLLLCKEMSENTNNVDSAIENFAEAHRLLLNNSNKGEKIKYVLRQVGLYHTYLNTYRAIMTEDQINSYYNKAIEMRERFDTFFNLPNTKLQKEMCRIYLDYHKMFEKTGYVLMLKDIDVKYNSLVPNKGMRVA